MPRRLNESVLAAGERRLLEALVSRLPASTGPDHLTALGLLGAAAAAAGLIGCHWSAAFLPLAPIGLFLNWFGNSLDGTLARHRGIERPRYGFLLDHSSDLIAQSLIVVGLGLSPYFTLPSAMFVLSLYLLMSSYTYLRVATEGVHRLAYDGMGATEFRLLVAAWVVFAHWAGPALIAARLFEFSALDVAVGTLSALGFARFVALVRADLARMQTEEADSATIYEFSPRRAADAAIAPPPEAVAELPQAGA